jgi:hypothetical protein
MSIDLLFANMITECAKIMTSDHSKQTITQGTTLITEYRTTLHNMKSHISNLTNIISQCEDFIKTIEEDLSVKRKKDNFVYKTVCGMLSYNDREHVVECPTSVCITTCGIKITLPVVKQLSEIPPMFYTLRDAVWCCVAPQIYVQVPFPEICNVSRDRTTRCKYQTVSCCYEHRRKTANYHGSVIRKCNFVHHGERIVKLGQVHRCAQFPDFGNIETLSSDLDELDNDSVRQILMYAVHDLYLIYMYTQRKKINNRIFDNLEIA